jgi:hypothetical protein
MRIFYLLLLLFFLSVVGIFAWQNQTVVGVKFLDKTFERLRRATEVPGQVGVGQVVGGLVGGQAVGQEVGVCGGAAGQLVEGFAHGGLLRGSRGRGRRLPDVRPGGR